MIYSHAISLVNEMKANLRRQTTLHCYRDPQMRSALFDCLHQKLIRQRLTMIRNHLLPQYYLDLYNLDVKKNESIKEKLKYFCIFKVLRSYLF